MKKLAIIVTILFSLSNIIILPALAKTENELANQDQAPEIKDFSGLRAEFKQHTQDPETKKIKFEMILKSNIDSDRVKISWQLTGVSKFADEKLKERDIDIVKGKSYPISIEIIPQGKGVTELLGKAESFQADSSFLVTVRKNFASNDAQEVLPISNDYNNARIFYILKTVLIYGGIALIIIFIAFISFKKFARWINKDEIEEYDMNIDGKIELNQPIVSEDVK